MTKTEIKIKTKILKIEFNTKIIPSLILDY